MALKDGLLIGEVWHKRHFPRKNEFRYKVYYLTFALRDLTKLGRSLLSVNKFNLFSFRERDHGARDGSSLEAWMRGVLKQERIEEADGDIVLVTMPRHFGYGFNPVSFWFCLDIPGHIRAVLAEVNNTFGEHHNYLVAHEDGRIIEESEWLAVRKVFHVSPFLRIEGEYRFRFSYSSDRIAVWINNILPEGVVLSTYIKGVRRALTSYSLLSSALRYPLISLKVIFLIHYQAVKLFMKKLRFKADLPMPEKELTR